MPVILTLAVTESGPALRLSGLPTAVLDTLPTDAAEVLAYHLAFANDLSVHEANRLTDLVENA